MSATQFGIGLLLYIAVAVLCYAAGWWQAKTVERDRREERAAVQDQLVQRESTGSKAGGAPWSSAADVEPKRHDPSQQVHAA